MLIDIASIFGFRISQTDVRQAYLQSAEDGQRDVFVRPCKVFELGPRKVLILLKPLYVILGIGDYLGRSFRKRLLRYTRMEALEYDHALFSLL